MRHIIYVYWELELFICISTLQYAVPNVSGYIRGLPEYLLINNNESRLLLFNNAARVCSIIHSLLYHRSATSYIDYVFCHDSPCFDHFRYPSEHVESYFGVLNGSFISDRLHSLYFLPISSSKVSFSYRVKYN